mmetsp:Transcript_13198/g.20566  ORF Transcript_13198/g.20566 Transcript_13198/m.20566 type:complete len:96 (-) Transcript_13198:597-884(-)
MVPKMQLMMANFFMIQLMNNLMQQKLRFKECFLSLLDSSQALVFGFAPCFPVANTYSASNYESLFDLLNVLEKMDDRFLRRGLIYGVSTTLLFSI